MSSFPFPDPRKEEEHAPTAPEAPPSPPPVAGKVEELRAPATQTAPPLAPPVAGKVEELHAPAPAPATQTAPPLAPPVAGKVEELRAPAPAPATQTAPPLAPPVAGKVEELRAPATQTAPPLAAPVTGKEEELRAPAPAPATQTAPPLAPPVAGKEQAEELRAPAPAPATQTTPPLAPPVAGKEQAEELPAPASLPSTIQVTMYDVSRRGLLHIVLPKTPPAELAVATLPADATAAEIERAAEILLNRYLIGGGGGGRDPYDTPSDDEGPFTDSDFDDDYVVGGGAVTGGGPAPAPAPLRPGELDFLLAGFVPIYRTSAADDQDQDQVRICKRKRSAEELENEFMSASSFVQALSFNVPEGHYYHFYGLHKVATEGLCMAPQPSPRNLKSHAEWNSWKKLSGMRPEEAMEEYVTAARHLFPSWGSAYYASLKHEETSVSAAGLTAPRLASNTNELEIGDIHVSARHGAIEELKKHLAAGVQMNTRDSEQRTPLHWAVDRGHLDAVEVLVSSNADVNAQDNKGQTALHYAVLCEREDIAELLVKHHADLQIKYGDGNTARDLCSLAWPFMKTAY